MRAVAGGSGVPCLPQWSAAHQPPNEAVQEASAPGRELFHDVGRPAHARLAVAGTLGRPLRAARKRVRPTRKALPKGGGHAGRSRSLSQYSVCRKAAHKGRGRGGFSGSKDRPAPRRGRQEVSPEVERIGRLAQTDPNLRFTALAHHLDEEFLRETWQGLNKRGVAGVDGASMSADAENLDENLKDLVQRLKAREALWPADRSERPGAGGGGGDPRKSWRGSRAPPAVGVVPAVHRRAFWRDGRMAPPSTPTWPVRPGWRPSRCCSWRGGTPQPRDHRRRGTVTAAPRPRSPRVERLVSETGVWAAS